MKTSINLYLIYFIKLSTATIEYSLSKYIAVLPVCYSSVYWNSGNSQNYHITKLIRLIVIGSKQQKKKIVNEIMFVIMFFYIVIPVIYRITT